MKKNELKKLSKRGLIIGPDETEDAFAKRALRSPPICDPVEIPFSCAPDWLTVTYENRGLSPWQGAATWIENGKARIQLRKAFKKKGKFLGYSEEEVLAHEAVHAVRLAFDEPRFEEIFAYMTARSKIRRYLGPLFRTPIEALLFILAALIAIPLQFFFPLIAFLPLAALLFSAARLFFDYNALRKAEKHLPLHVLFHLTDKEILQVAKGTIPVIESVRGEQIKTIS